MLFLNKYNFLLVRPGQPKVARNKTVKFKSMDAIPPIVQGNTYIENCDSDYCINGICTVTKHPLWDQQFKQYYETNSTYCRCKDGYNNLNQCTWSKIQICVLSIFCFLN